jgi:hypothetical protein
MRKELEELGERIAVQAAHVDAAMHGLLKDLREFDVKKAWGHAGAQSCAHWLTWRVGWDLPTAREHVRVARRLGELPLIDDTLRRGAISYSKVRAITRIATPAMEEMLLVYAKATTAAQLEKICRKFRLVQRLENKDADKRPPERHVRRRELDDGMIKIEVVVRPEEAAMVWSAMEAAGKDVSAEGFDRVDGLMALAQARLRGDRQERSPVEVVVTMDRAALSKDHEATDVGVMADGTCVSAEACRRLTCDCSIVEMVVENGVPLSVGRKTRNIPIAILRALEHRDGRCTFPGCCNKAYLEAHHVKHWGEGGETELSNLVLLCGFHHTFVHEHGYTIVMGDDQKPQFFDPRGRLVRVVPPRPMPSTTLVEEHRELAITPDTNRCKWDGNRIDYPAAVNGLWVTNERRSQPRG